MLSFLDRLHTKKPLLCDGAMGTVLESRGYYTVPCDLLTLTAPQAVEQVHLDYITAGAEMILTNTYSSTPIKLAGFNAGEKCHEINRVGVELARNAVRRSGKNIYVAGSVGPVGKLLAPVGKIFPEEAYTAFVSQITSLVEAGVDVLVLETFLDLRELDLAIAAAKKVAPTVPIIAQKTFSEDGSILAGSFPLDVMEHLREQDVAVIGSNCTVGPQRMYTIFKQAHQDGVILSAMPTAGIPTMSNGRQVYNATPEYLAGYARQLVEVGVTVIGACCGSTPAHIKAIADAIEGMTVGNASKIEVKVKSNGKVEREESVKNMFRSVYPDKVSNLRRKLFEENKFVTTVELDIPRGLDMSSVIEGAAYLKEHGVDAANISDGARARLRMDSTAICKIVEDLTGMETLMHFTCRDRNMIALQSELLGAYAMGLRNVLVVTGDPSKIGDYPQATSVYDLDSPNLIRAAASLNSGVDLMKNSIGDAHTDWFITSGANPLADDFEMEMIKTEKKIDAGAECLFTQPVYELPQLERFIERLEKINAKLGTHCKVILGVLPLRSYQHADFLHHEVPGIDVPKWIRERLQKADKKDASKVGVELSGNFLRQARTMVSGAYFMPPFKKYEMVTELMQAL